jgi:8-oxo-dGTP pyrophosphatase MutT (NUDIX family)
VNTPAEARPASTVVLLRDGDHGLETLLLKRNKALLFAGGLWVFPGGALEEQDMVAGGGDVEQAARIAAWREAQEESGLQPHLEQMIQLSHWTTPVAEPKRFYTWIYAAPVAADDEVVIDGSEIHDHQWVGVRDAVAAHRRGEFGLLPPTFITLCDLARFDSVAAFLSSERERVPDEVFPVMVAAEEGILVMFRGDAGYDSGDALAPGARHRAELEDGSWRYVYEDVDPAVSRLVG